MNGVSPVPSLPSTPSSRSTIYLVAELDQSFNDLTIAQARISTVSAILTNRERTRSRLPLVVAVPVDHSPPLCLLRRKLPTAINITQWLSKTLITCLASFRVALAILKLGTTCGRNRRFSI